MARVSGRVITLAFLLFTPTSYTLAAEPYLSMPSEISAACSRPAVVVPKDVLSLFYPSDECGVIFIGPPSRLTVQVAAEFAAVSAAECVAMDSLINQKNELMQYRAEVSKKIVDGTLTLAQLNEEKGKISAAEEILADGLADDFETYGSKSTLAIQQDWQSNVRAYEESNPDYIVYPLNTVAGILSFEEVVQEDVFEAFGVYQNKMKAPFIEYTVSGMPPIAADSPLLDEGKLPIFFPTARVDRANLKSVEFSGGGISASVTLNRYGYCDYSRNDDQDLAAFLVPTVTYAMALKTSGEYSIDIKIDYFLRVLESLSKETSGTYSALALADDFYRERGTNTIDVVLDNDLKNSLSPEDADGFVQTILIDVASQYLTTITGVAGEKRQIQLPKVDKVEKYRTVQKIQTVCNRKSGFFGIGASERCYDQAYDVRVLQDTSKYQEAVSTINANFSAGGATKIRSYILVPWNASL